MKKIGVISDTHGYIDERILNHLKECDEIWHAGDIGDLNVTDQLQNAKPLIAVYGNIDDHLARRTFPETVTFKCEDLKVCMTHIGGRPYKYKQHILPKIESYKPNIFVCGHSHILCVKYDKKYNTLYINPGAAGIKGFHQVRTLVRFVVDGKDIKDMEVIELGHRVNKSKESLEKMQ